jgi:ligand-binding sensor domain-containing protein
LNIDLRWLVIAVVAVAALVAGAYTLGLKQSGRQPVAAVSTSGNGGAPPLPAQAPVAAPLPAEHPPMPTGQPPMPGADKVASRSGVSFTHFRVGNRNIKAMLADGPIMWVGTSAGVIRYDTTTDQYRLFDVRSGLLSNGVFHLSKLDDRLVVGTYGGGLSLLDPATESWTNLNIQHGLGDAFVYDFLRLANGDIWIATWSGANRVRAGDLENRESWDLFTVENTAGGLPNDWVYGLAEGKQGEVWMATEGGLARFKDSQWRHWTHADGLGAPYEMVRDEIQYMRDPAKESSHHARQKVEQGLGNVDVAYNPNYIVSLLVADDGSVWCGTWGGGLAHFDGERWRNYTMADGLPGDHVFMLSRGKGGTMWVGTSRGLARRVGNTFETFTTADGLFADNVFSMATDEQGRVWVGSFGGVARISGLVSTL